MPAKSKSQQRLFGMALAVRRGEMKRKDAWKEVLDIVDSDMTDKEIEDFASTSHKGLKEGMKNIKEYINESFIHQSIDVKHNKKIIFIYYNFREETVTLVKGNDEWDLEEDYGIYSWDAKELVKLDIGESIRRNNGDIYTRIS